MTALRAYDLTLFDLMYEDALMPEKDEEKKAESAYEALIMCVNRKGCRGDIDLDYMSRISGLTADSLISKLHGTAIIQNPEYFRSEPVWQKTKGWMLMSKYLCGNILHKLKAAKEMNRRFEGFFEKNIELLKSRMPAKLTLDDIHVGLGAVWVPAHVYELFLKELFEFTETPRVEYLSELDVWKIEAPDEAKHSVMNNITYGTWRMSGIKIAEKTMNAATVKVYDEIPDYKSFYSCERILNEAETLAAQEKQNDIISRFSQWILNNKAVRRILEEKYHESFVGFSHSRYSGDFLELPDINPDVSLYPHQRTAVARVVLSDENVLLAHDVGAGKTYEMIISVHELRRLGLSNKNLIVVPNNIFSAFVDAHRYLYPDDSILAISPKDFTPDKRRAALESVRDGDYDAIYMAYSSFDMVVMSKTYWINKKHKEIIELRRAASQKDRMYNKKRLRSEAERLEKKLEEYINTAKETDWPDFDELGIETLIVDEAHNYKNIPFRSSADNVVGMNARGSKKCREMLEKVHFVKRTIFATGTPVTNSLADLYTLQTYLQPEVLAFRRIDSFDNWMQTFAARETHLEVKPDSSDIRPVTRFASFHNLTELMGMFSCVCDFHYTDEKKDYLPLFRGHTDITLQKSKVQAEHIAQLAERSERIRTHKVDRTEDNPLKITISGRVCALDPRLLGLEEPESDRGKIATCAGCIAELYRKYPGTSQAVFCDLGTPKNAFNVYDALRAELISRGIAPREIAYIHDATTEKARTNLFSSVNEAETRVIIGSTTKLGVGVNIQKKLIAAHMLSVPWRPSDMLQSEGRIIRRGNECDEVFIYRYITQGTFDSYSWQRLESKARFICSFLSGTAAERNADDVQDMVLSYAEVKALAIGNGLIRKRVETANRLERVKMAGRQRQKQLMDLSEVMSRVPGEIRRLKERICTAVADKAFYEAHKESIPNSERIAFGEELKLALEENAGFSKERFFTCYQGFDICLPADMYAEKPYVLLQREKGGKYPVSVDCDKLLGYSKKLDYFLDHFSDYTGNLEKSVAKAEKRRAEAKADYEKGNAYYEQAEQLRKELKEIDEELLKIRQEKKNENSENK